MQRTVAPVAAGQQPEVIVDHEEGRTQRREMAERITDVPLEGRIQWAHLIGRAPIRTDDLLKGRRLIGHPPMPDRGLGEDADFSGITLERLSESLKALSKNLRFVHGRIALGHQCHHAGDMRADARFQQPLRISGEFAFASGNERHDVEGG